MKKYLLRIFFLKIYIRTKIGNWERQTQIFGSEGFFFSFSWSAFFRRKQEQEGRSCNFGNCEESFAALPHITAERKLASYRVPTWRCQPMPAGAISFARVGNCADSLPRGEPFFLLWKKAAAWSIFSESFFDFGKFWKNKSLSILSCMNLREGSGMLFERQKTKKKIRVVLSFFFGVHGYSEKNEPRFCDPECMLVAAREHRAWIIESVNVRGALSCCTAGRCLKAGEANFEEEECRAVHQRTPRKKCIDKISD